MKKPMNFRRVKLRNCLNCKHRIIATTPGTTHTIMICERDQEPREDEPEHYVCDYWKK